MTGNKLAVLLACFSRTDEAGKARKQLDSELRSTGAPVLDAVVLSVDKRHRAKVHDPGRLLAGTLVPLVTWGLFGLVANGWVGVVIWAPLGALCGFLNTYYSVHHASKAELATIGKELPPESSALLLFSEVGDPGDLLAGAAKLSPTTASVVGVADDLSVAGSTWASGAAVPEAGPVPRDAAAALASMIVVRYRSPGTARTIATKVKSNHAVATAVQIELVVRTDPRGRRHVADPTFGAAAMVRSNIVSWGLFGLVVGAISGAFGGGILRVGLLTGIGWAVFGIFAGALYGLWAGRSISGRRLRSVSSLLPDGTSAILAWTSGPPPGPVLDALSDITSEHAIVAFVPSGSGAVVRSGGL
ncbi:hypothetical protein ACRAWB_16750 [Leifsonia poae]|uniref:hypothetical protein n=1 Tax=Leifsonia poae TaxID=110933 RepID=UPI003D69A548